MHDELKRLKQKLFALQQEKEYFIGIASHDLQHPLSIINHLCEFMLSPDTETLSREQKKAMGLIKEAANEMTGLFQNYLQASRNEFGKAQAQLEKINVTKLTHNIVYRYMEVSRKKDIMIHIDTDKEYILLTDSDYYSRILENLLSNAIKYTMPSKNVYVTMYEKNGRVYTEIKDEGVGIKKKELPLLFEKFQLLSSRPTGNELSTGLGLNITKFLLEQLNGCIQVSSRWGKGSVFTISFPHNTPNRI